MARVCFKGLSTLGACCSAACTQEFVQLLSQHLLKKRVALDVAGSMMRGPRPQTLIPTRGLEPT